MENSAWLLKDINGDYFAVCEVEMVEYIQIATIFPVPATPRYCNHVMAWRDKLLPVVNIALLFDVINKVKVGEVGVFAYQTAENSPLNHIAIPLLESPVHIIVNDNQYCDLPERYSKDQQSLALSCFSYQDFSVPILNLNYLCSTEFRNNNHTQ